MDGAAEFGQTAAGTTVETWPAQRLLLLWPPQGARAPQRWPRQVQLLAVPADDVALAALALRPDGAALWLQTDAMAVDWMLGAEIALHHLPTLRLFQRDGLRTFIDRERDTVFAALNNGYRQQVPGGPAQRV